jgi:nicotinamidase-related amidase
MNMAQHHPPLRIPAQPYPFPHATSSTTISPLTTALLIIDMQRDFLEPGGYLTAQNLDHQPLRRIIPSVSRLLQTFRQVNFPVIFTREGHRSDLSTLPYRELWRSRLATGRGIGDLASDGSMGRMLVRGEPGHDIIPELKSLPYPQPQTLTSTSSPPDLKPKSRLELVLDKPLRSAFTHTDLELILRNHGIKYLIICGVTTDVCVTSTMREGNDRGFECLIVEDACAAGTEEGHRESVESVKGEGGIFGCVAGTEGVVRVVEAVGKGVGREDEG